MGRNRMEFDVSRAVRLYNGPPEMTIAEVAKVMGVSKTVVEKRFRERGVRGRRGGGGHKVMKMSQKVEIDILRRLYKAILASEMTYDHIAADAGVDPSLIRHWIKRGVTPSFMRLYAVAAAVGLELTFVPAPRRIAAEGYALAEDQ